MNKKRERKSKHKGKKRVTLSTNISKLSPEPVEHVSEDPPPAVKKYSRSKVKKKEQYRNQVIEDQFGVFEYDKDPDGYLKARKRMLNRKSKVK